MGQQREVAAGFFHAVDIGHIGQHLVGIGGEGHAGAAGHVVQDDGQIGAGRDVLIVLDQAGLAGLVVVGGDVEQGVCAVVLSMLGQVNGSGGIVAARAGNDLDPLVHPLDTEFHSGVMLANRHGSGLAGGAADTDSIHASGNLIIDKFSESVVIDVAACVKGSDEGGAGAGKDRSSHVDAPFLSN